MMKIKFLFATKLALLVTLTGLGAVAAAQGGKQEAYLRISDAAAAEKILDIMRQEADSKSYRFQGVKRDATGKSQRIDQGALSIAQVRQFNQIQIKRFGKIDSTAVIHEVLKEFFSKNALDRIQAVLKNVDKRLYVFDVKQAQ